MWFVNKRWKPESKSLENHKIILKKEDFGVTINGNENRLHKHGGKKGKKTYKKHILEATRFRSPSRFTKKKRGRNHPTQKKEIEKITRPKIPQYARWFRSESTKILQNQHHMSIHLQTD